MATQSRKTHATLGTKSTKTGTMQRVAGYLRVSTDEQAESGLGLAAQESVLRAMAAAKGWGDLALYTDAGVSGTKDSRPYFDLLKAAIEARQIDAVIVKSLDRIGRKTPIILDFAELCELHNVTLISVNESFDTSTPAGTFALTLFAGLAQMERDTIAERTTAALDQRGEKYDYKSGQLPLGYKRVITGDSEHIALDEEGANLARRILRMDRRGASLYAIAQKLNTQGIPARRGGKWYASSVRVILAHKDTYKGKHSSYPPLG